ncbi:CRISPR-associated protein Cas4 [Desulfurococcus mucosus]|uniref:CRISPR-associated exonuclease Cas4 n=1 Tax=Desulfurococcus mucosus (strain ATCC 35584 / DSM 2162 / JCM 9187 / O7/1) TaxID=765177 RepID=E8R707_DESM0|nr:CRISPR-associated protein Cas4 [Desulfurococcus mucosus]ADV64440.1 CRISPR-associated protein Cas4 [Desulfurococcus mucosus DSM 2162]
MYRASSLVTEALYRRVIGEHMARMGELRDGSTIYVTDLVACSHKYHMRRKYPELTIGFEPSMVLGELLHKGLEEVLKGEGYEVEKSVEVPVEIDGARYIVKGRVDAYNPGTRTVVEIKSSRTSRGIPKPHHVEQLNIYLNIMDVESGILVYVTSDKIVEYVIPRERVDVTGLVRNTLGNLVHPRYEWECEYCVFRRLCPYAREEGEKLYTDTGRK